MSSKGMQLDQFTQLAQTWGGQIERWPEAERDAAYALLSDDQRALQQLIEAAEMDHLIGPIVAPSTALRGKILKDARSLRPEPSFLQRLWAELGGIRLVAPALASSLLLAFALVQFDPTSASSSEDELFNLALLAVEDEEYLP